MRKVTFLFLSLFVGFSIVCAQSDLDGKRSKSLHKLFTQDQPTLKASYVPSDFIHKLLNLGSKPDSSVIITSDYELETRIIYKFETNKETIDYHEWDNDLNEVAPMDRKESIYDANGNLIVHIKSEWDNGRWNPWDKMEYEYDANGAMIYAHIYNYTDFWQWELFATQKVETVLNSGSPETVASQIYYNKINEAWVPVWKEEYTYDASGRELSNTYSIWNMITNGWELESRDISEYGTDGKLMYYYEEEWDEGTQSWKPDGKKHVCHYDSKGRLSSWDIFKVNEDTGAWNTPESGGWTYQETFYYPKSGAGIHRVTTAQVKIGSNKQTICIEGESELSKVSIYNAAGVLLSAQQLSGCRAFIDGSGLYPDIIIVDVKMANGQSKVEKIVLR